MAGALDPPGLPPAAEPVEDGAAAPPVTDVVATTRLVVKVDGIPAASVEGLTEGPSADEAEEEEAAT